MRVLMAAAVAMPVACSLRCCRLLCVAMLPLLMMVAETVMPAMVLVPPLLVFAHGADAVVWPWPSLWPSPCHTPPWHHRWWRW